MGKSTQIRVVALGLIQDGDRIFLSQGYDPIKQETFYRALGGGVEFGERSSDALQREFQEEIQAELMNIKYLACIENIFEFNGKQGHEITLLYKCEFADPKFYQVQQLTFFEDSEEEHKQIALWMPIEPFKSEKLRVYPENFLQYCQG